MFISKSDLLKLVLDSKTDMVEIPLEFMRDLNTTKLEKIDNYPEIIRTPYKEPEVTEPFYGEEGITPLYKEKEATKPYNTKSINNEQQWSQDDVPDYIKSYVKDPRYAAVLMHKKDYLTYLKELDIRYYNAIKLVSALNNMVGFRIIPKLTHSKFKELDKTDKFNLIAQLKESVIEENPLLFKKEIKHIPYSYMFTYTKYTNNQLYNLPNIADLYSAINPNFKRYNRYIDTLRVMALFLTTDQLLAALIRPAVLINPKTKKFAGVTPAFSQVPSTTASPVYELKYNLKNFEQEMREEVQKFANLHAASELDTILNKVSDRYNEVKDKQFIELIIPDFEIKYLRYKRAQSEREFNMEGIFDNY